MKEYYTHDFIKSEGPLTVDFSKHCGQIKRELTCTNYAPTLSTGYASNKYFKELRSYATRTHDLAVTTWGQHVFDTKMIFPLEHRDPADPNNYLFRQTDDVVANIYAQGTKVYFRLGTSIEVSPIPFNAVSPKDYHHYAEVCAGIIRHYTRGWANGFHYDMPYWEIFNECDAGVSEWTDSQEQFHQFFEIMVRRLKAEFPELKISGPAYCTFWADWMEPFLAYARDHKVPLDFYSFHCYHAEIYPTVNVPFMMRKMLDKYGFTETAIHITEWHPLLEHMEWSPSPNIPKTAKLYDQTIDGHAGYHGIDMGAFVAAVFIGWHDAPIDLACDYGYGRDDGRCGHLTLFNTCGKPNKEYYALKMACDLACDTPNRVLATGGDQDTWILAGTDKTGKHAQILLADHNSKAKEFTITLKGVKKIKKAILNRVTHLQDAEQLPLEIKDNTITIKKDYMFSSVMKLQLEF